MVDHKKSAERLADVLVTHIMEDHDSISLNDITDEDALLILKEVVAITERRLENAKSLS